jgi:hypothetical protein
MDVRIIEKRGDYVHVVCNQCQQSCDMEFTEYDGTFPLVKISCPTHGTMGPLKVWNAMFSPRFKLSYAATLKLPNTEFIRELT